MMTVVIIDSLLLGILLVLIVIKTLHFYRYISTKRRNLINWIYFDHKNVIRSHSSKSIAIKRKQNSYSVRIGITLIIIVCVIVLEFLVLDQTLPGSQHNTERPTAPTIIIIIRFLSSAANTDEWPSASAPFSSGLLPHIHCASHRSGCAPSHYR